MFQYAAGLNLANMLNTNLMLETSMLDNDKLRNFSLGCFDISGVVIGQKQFKNFFTLPLTLIRKFGFLCNFGSKMKLYKEKSFNFDNNFLNQKGDICIDGFWQSEKYFENISKLIKKEFSLKEKISIKSKKNIEKIKSQNSVSCHVRRSDYINNPNTNSFHGTCSIEWYIKSINYIYENVNNPKFYIFSDDINWTKKNFPKDNNFKFISNSKYQKDFEDLYLMSNCKHNIIANSSFSWWSAWLNKNTDKIVIAPECWFKAKIDTSDLIPQNWIRH